MEHLRTIARDRCLVTAEQGLEPRRFTAFYEEHMQRVYGFLAYRLPLREEAEDLTQVVFEKALRAWGRYDASKGSHATWVMAIARNVLVDHLRRRRDERELDPEHADLLVAEPETGVSAELATALGALKERERTVLALRYGGDLTGGEIGELMGLSTDNVHQILSRSLRRLRAELDGRPPAD